MAVREETKEMKETMMEMGMMGELPLSFGSAKANKELELLAR